jgi:5'-3' exoribonuclease 2
MNHLEASGDLSTREDQSKHDPEYHKAGFKQRYYRRKFSVNYDEKPPLLNDISSEYTQGLCWVLLYYYQGCPSWSW